MSSRTLRLRPLALSLFIFLTSLLNTCVHHDASSPHAGSESEISVVQVPGLEVISEPLNPAVRSLLSKTQSAIDKKQWQVAEAHAERAYRMEGRDFRVLVLLAEINLGQGKPEDAEQWANRALSFLPEKYPGHRKSTWSLIARSRRVRGDQPGYEQAILEAQH